MCDLIKDFTERQQKWILNGYGHFTKRMYERFNIKVSLNTYINHYVKKNNYNINYRDVVEKQVLIKKVKDLEKIMVYSVIYGVEYPVTIYPVDKFNYKKSKIITEFNVFENYIGYNKNKLRDMLNKGLITYYNRKNKKGKSK